MSAVRLRAEKIQMIAPRIQRTRDRNGTAYPAQPLQNMKYTLETFVVFSHYNKSFPQLLTFWGNNPLCYFWLLHSKEQAHIIGALVSWREQSSRGA